MYKRLQKLLLEGLSGASRAYKTHTRKYFDLYRTAPTSKKIWDKAWEKMFVSKAITPKSKKRSAQRSGDAYSKVANKRFARRSLKSNNER